MITLAQRIEALRTERGLSRPALSQALGFPKNAAEKFETGRQTPTREQQEKMAAFFGVSLFYLRGESNDPIRQDDLHSKAFQDMIRAAVQEALRSPEGQDILTQAVRKELARQR